MITTRLHLSFAPASVSYVPNISLTSHHPAVYYNHLQFYNLFVFDSVELSLYFTFECKNVFFLMLKFHFLNNEKFLQRNSISQSAIVKVSLKFEEINSNSQRCILEALSATSTFFVILLAALACVSNVSSRVLTYKTLFFDTFFKGQFMFTS